MNGATLVKLMVSSDPKVGSPWRAGIVVSFKDPAGRDKIWSTYVMDPDRDCAILDCLHAVETDIRRVAFFDPAEWLQFEPTVRCLATGPKTSWDVVAGTWISAGFILTPSTGPLGTLGDPLQELIGILQTIPPGTSLAPPPTPTGYVTSTGGGGIGTVTIPPGYPISKQDLDDGSDSGKDGVDLLDLVSM
jgi:hypothetical protein